MVEGGGQFEECVEGDGGFVEYGQQMKKVMTNMKKVSTNIRHGQQPRRQDQSPGVVKLHGGQSHRRAKS